jgi:serine protease Do
MRGWLLVMVFAAGIAGGGAAVHLWGGSLLGAGGGSSGSEADSAASPAPALVAGVPGFPGGAAEPAAASSSAAEGREPAGDEIGVTRRNAIVRAAERVGPAVVSISVTQIRLVRGSPFGAGEDPFDRFFSRFFPGRLYGQEISSLGSGVIVDRRGIVVTNEHVVRNAAEIKVSLPDGRTFDATLVGSDRAYDLAVLRIEGEDLPAAPVGDSDALLVGEWAIALGNPFGFLLNDYQPTVTVGVISATNRDVKPEGDTEAIYKNMIQTDAAINPGNSGGPLVDAQGDVIGINTFIFSTGGGGNVGMGFALPVNTVIRVVREILEYGRVRQVWIGIRVQEISQMVANYFRIRDRRGLLVWGIDEGSPADRAGIQVGDIIRRVNGQEVTRAAEAQRLIFGATIGDRIVLSMERDGRQWEVTLQLEEAPAERAN